MAVFDSIKEVLQHSSVNGVNIEGGKAKIDFVVSGSEDSKAAFEYIVGTWAISEICVFLNTDMFLDEDENDFEGLEEDYYDKLDVKVFDCIISADIRTVDMKADWVLSGTVDGKDFSVSSLEIGDDSVGFGSEDAEWLLAAIENSKSFGPITADNYENEIYSLLWCDAVPQFVKRKVAYMKEELKDGSTIRYGICPITHSTFVPVDANVRYMNISVSQYNNDKFDKIYDFCMSRPELHWGEYAGSHELCLVRSGNERLICFATVRVISTKPCHYSVTKDFNDYEALIKKGMERVGLKVSELFLDVDEEYTLKRSDKVDKVHNEHRVFFCEKCTHKLGFFSKYSEAKCKHVIGVKISNR